MTTQTVTDELLGTLTWNTELDWWEGHTEIAPGQRIRFSITQENEDGTEADFTKAVSQARNIMLFLREHEPEGRIVAADELLEIYNAEWNEDAPLGEDEFVGRLVLDDVNVAANGAAELFYRDDGLFAGYTVVVTLDTHGNFADADIAG